MADLYDYLLSQKAEGWHLLGRDVIRSLCDHVEDWIKEGHCTPDQKTFELEEQIDLLKDEISESKYMLEAMKDNVAASTAELAGSLKQAVQALKSLSGRENT